MEANIKKAINYLKTDTVLREVIKQFDVPKIKVSKKYFESLVESIIYQQLSGKSAFAIHRKFKILLKNKINPKNVLALSDSDFKKAGVSPQKMNYLRDLSLKFYQNKINSRDFSKMSDEEIIEHLIIIKGVGRWTAQMFLMFTLGRLDVFPVGDLGIQKGFMYAYNLKKNPSEKKIIQVSKNWSPYRTIASMYLWKLADKMK